MRSLTAGKGGLLAVATLVAALSLTGCGDLDPGSVEELFDQAREAVDELEESLDDVQQGAEAQERWEERLDWETRPTPPDIEPNSTRGTATDEAAIEVSTYESEHYDAVVDHFTDAYGEPGVYQDGPDRFPEWSGEDYSVIVYPVDDATGDFEVEMTYAAP